MVDKSALLRLTAEVVSSYVGNPSLTDGELDQAIEKLPLLIDRVHEALTKILGDEATTAAPSEPRGAPEASPPPDLSAQALIAPTSATTHVTEPTVADDYIICLEDGRKMKTLSRHLRTHHGLTPEAYRTKWGLPADYPMTCAAYARTRSDVAKRIGLGLEGRGSKPAYVDEQRRRPKSRKRA